MNVAGKKKYPKEYLINIVVFQVKQLFINIFISIILGVVKRNPLFFHSISCKNNGFLFTIPNIKIKIEKLNFLSHSLDNQLAYAASQLERLKKTNVFNATFHIWHSGHFGTINSFRLGRLPSAPVDWSEINAAWGQTTLLLVALARKMNLTFKRFRLVPFGNHSYIEALDQNKELPLYGSGGFKFLWDTKFDAAMVAFLDCLQQFKEQVEKGDSEFCLPYRMDRGKIEDSATGNSYSIKYV